MHNIHTHGALHVWVWLPLCVPSAINELLRNEMRNEWKSETAITTRRTTTAAKQRLFSLRVFLPTVCCCCWFIITPACNGKLQAMITTHKHIHTPGRTSSYSKIDSNLIYQRREGERDEAKICLHFNRNALASERQT